MAVYESIKPVVERAKDVLINESKCRESAMLILKEMDKRDFSIKTWSTHELTPSYRDQRTIDWIFTVDLLNFSFWSNVDDYDTGKAESQRYAVEYNQKKYTGYWSLVAAINKALDKGIPITTPSYWLTEDFVNGGASEIFKSSTNESMPMYEERVQVLQEAGKVFEKFGFTSFTEFLELADHSSQDLIQLVIQNFNSFDDIHYYYHNDEKIKVEILKRVQILIADIWACFEGEGYGEFHDIDTITMFADYRIPQMLHTLGCLEYSSRLKSRLDNLELISSGDSMEIELRACSIWAVKLIVEELKKTINTNTASTVNAILVDFYLWDTAKEFQQQLGGIGYQTPCHRTRSVYY